MREGILGLMHRNSDIAVIITAIALVARELMGLLRLVVKKNDQRRTHSVQFIQHPQGV